MITCLLSTILASLSVCVGLHSALLRLLATNYPHLCLVEDWVCEEVVTGTLPLLRRMMLPSNTCRYTQNQLHQGEEKSGKIILYYGLKSWVHLFLKMVTYRLVEKSEDPKTIYI